MFNNLYEVEQAGWEHQQVLLAVQYQAEQVVQNPGTSAPKPPCQAFRMLAKHIRTVIGSVIHQRTMVG